MAPRLHLWSIFMKVKLSPNARHWFKGVLVHGVVYDAVVDQSDSEQYFVLLGDSADQAVGVLKTYLEFVED